MLIHVNQFFKPNCITCNDLLVSNTPLLCRLVRSSGREILGVPYFPGISRYRGTKVKAWDWDGTGLGSDLRYCRFSQP